MPETVEQVAQFLVKNQICTDAQVQEALDIQQKMRDMGINPKPLAEILLDKGYISKEQHRDLTARPIYDKSSLERDSIPGYDLLTKVGQGGMGAVFKARQVSMDRIVALKVLPPRLAKDGQFRERFLREARAVAKLNHENIIQGIDVGSANGLYYFVMEFVDGKAVSKRLSDGKALPEKEALTITAQIARALEHANRHKLVHRDVKPENIMVTGEGVAKLCDLGLAKQETGDTSLTQAGLSVGTPNYISPEQARGEADVDIRSDVYSLGASLYHMLTGKVPFDGNVPSVVMTKHITEELVPPAKVKPEISGEANAIVLKAMQKRREDRYQDPEKMAADLEAVAAGRPLVHAKIPGRKGPAAAPGAAPGGPSTPAPAHKAHHAVARPKQGAWMIPVAVSMVAAAAILGGVFAMTRGGDKPKDDGEGATAERGGGRATKQPDDPPKEQNGTNGGAPVEVNADAERKIEAEFRALAGYIEVNATDASKHGDIEARLEEFISSHRKTEWENRGIAEQKKYRDGLDRQAQGLLAKIAEETAPLRKDRKFWEAMTLARSKWPRHLEATATKTKFDEMVASLNDEMQAAWTKDWEEAKALAARREYDKAQKLMDGVEAYASPEIQMKARGLRDGYKAEADSYAASLAALGKKRFAEEFMPALEKLLHERKYTEALSLCGKFDRDPELAGERARIGALLDDVMALNLLLPEAQRGADAAIKSRETLSIKNFEVRVTSRDGDRVQYAFLNGGSSEIALTKADEGDVAALAKLGFNALPADRKASERGPHAFRVGLLFYYTPDDKDRKRAAEEFERAKKDGVARAQHYLDRLAERGMSDADVAAKRLYDEAAESFAAKKYGEARPKYQRLLTEHGATALVKEKKAEIQARIAECDKNLGGTPAAESTGLQKLLKGEVVRTYSKGQVEVRYDFSREDQLQDWVSVEGGWTWDKENECLRGNVTENQLRGALSWKVPLVGDASMELDLTPLSDKNIGFAICNDTQSSYYMAIFGGTFTPAILQALGNPDLGSAALVKGGGGGRALSVIKSAGEPRLARGAPIKIRISRADKSIALYVGGKRVLQGVDDAYTWGHLSLWLLGSEARFDEITIFGTPDDKWLKQQK